VRHRHCLTANPEGKLKSVIGRRTFDAVIRELSMAIDTASQARSDAIQARLEAKEIVRESRSLRESRSPRREQLRLRGQGSPSGNRAA